MQQPEPEIEPVFGQPHHVRMLLAVRKRYGWSQAQLARQLQVSERTIRRWESDRDPPVFLMGTLRELLSDADVNSG